jgi:receptor expression-enhancing protein 1/2/3/4
VYYTYIEPFIVQHEQDIDIFIGQAHERLSAAGLGYLNQLIDLFVERILGRAPSSSTSAPQNTASYAQSLFSRFAIPSARDSIVAPASDFYGMLSGAVAAVSTTLPAARARDTQADPLSSSTLYPKSLAHASTTEKLDFIVAQREKLAVLIKALDREQQILDLAYGDTSDGGFEQKKNKSTHSFETVEHADAENSSHASQHPHHHYSKAQAGSRTTSGNWIPSGWWPSGGNTNDKSSGGGGSPGWNAARDITEAVQGTSSSIDTGR